MSIATIQRQRQCEERSLKHQQSNVQTRQNTPNNHDKQPQQQQKSWNPGKSIVIGNQTQDTTHVNKKSKQLTKQTPVASTESVSEQGEEQCKTDTLATEIETNLELHKVNGHDFSEQVYATATDYQIYQNAKVNDFFKAEENGDKPKTISDVCLVNDHFILVKMPSPKVINDSTNHTQQLQRSNRRLCHYLSTKRNRVRKIAPINEEPEDFELSEKESGSERKLKSKANVKCLNVNSCWPSSTSNDEELEVYQTRTKILRPPVLPHPSAVIHAENKSVKTCTIPSKADNNNLVENLRLQEVQSISGTVLTSSLQDRVTLRNQASLVGSDNNNVDISYCRQSCSPPRRRKCPHFESLHWLLRPFRGKYRKPKPKIQAVVYKTYFVKWTKPPEILNHGYGGVKSTQFSNMGTSVIRRCRSAIF